MRTNRATLAAAVVAALAATLMTGAPADAATPKIRAKVVCQDNGNTRVKITAEVTGKKDEMVGYSWTVAGRDAHKGSVLMVAPYDAVLLAFTVPAGGTAHVEIGPDLSSRGLFEKEISARRC